MSLNNPKGHSVTDYELTNGSSSISVANLTTSGTVTATGAITASGGITSTGAIATTGTLTVGTTTIAANSTGTQASGTAIPATAGSVAVTSAGTAYSVTLPASAPGMKIDILTVTASNTVAVFPNAGGTGTETINALSANAGLTMGVRAAATFICVVAGQWYTNPRVPS